MTARGESAALSVSVPSSASLNRNGSIGSTLAPRRPLPAPLHNRAVGCGQLVIRFGVTEDKSEVSYLSQFHLLNATGCVWLNL
jgi:hypothetical protein